MLVGWGGLDVFREAELIIQRGAVSSVKIEDDRISGVLALGANGLRTAVRVIKGGSVESLCPCRVNQERGCICSHVVALGLHVAKRQSDPNREQNYQIEQRRARRLAALDPARYIKRAGPGVAGSKPARLELKMGDDWRHTLDRDAFVTLECAVRIGGARLLSPEQVAGRIAVRLDKRDDALLYVLEDICEGPARSRIKMSPADFYNVLELHCGRSIQVGARKVLHVSALGAKTPLSVSMDQADGCLNLSLSCVIGDATVDNPIFVVHGPKGWVQAGDRIFQLEKVLPLPYQALYAGPVRIARENLLQFANRELPLLAGTFPVDSDFSLEDLDIQHAVPSFTLVLKGSPASLAAELRAHYGSRTLEAGAPDNDESVAEPDPEDPLRYRVRNISAERKALLRLNTLGLKGERGGGLSPVTGSRDVLNLVGSGVASLRRLGWNVQFEGRIAEQVEQLEMVVPVVRIDAPPEEKSFEVSFDYESSRGGVVTGAEVQRSLRKGDYFMEFEGRTLLLDADAINAMQEVFRDAFSSDGHRPGSFRMDAVHAPFVSASLQALDGVDVEQPRDWRVCCEKQNRQARIEPVKLPKALSAKLRPYQRRGIEWLRFLEKQGFSGILADEMGLGKTLQALAWLRMERHDPETTGLPALVVCPTSLVENWAREAEKFVPETRVLVIAGNRRHDLWTKIPEHDLVITSYALLRRDQERYLGFTFSAVLLDEAQHIKNPTTQNARSAKKLSAYHRLVLTGTPVENSVSDLWSIMDFLMPGYLGPYEVFRETCEIPITRGDREGDAAQRRLRRKLHPFMLRRLKRDVAKDLPPKLEKVSYCLLSDSQQRVYNALIEASRRRVNDMVAEQGFNRSRMQILAILMRLRQVCCHLDLLKAAAEPGDDSPAWPGDALAGQGGAPEAGSNGEAKSAKLAQFFELLDEAIDGGHRMLVFSQFVSMLRILRRELESRDISYAYLDGSTKNRMEEVQRFNRRRDIPLFLISLRAGGTGLNLTGADMVVHFDPWWNPAVEDQATDRAHRIGQEKSVYSVKLIAEHTIEEKVLALQLRKREIIRETVEKHGEVPTSLSWREIKELLSL